MAELVATGLVVERGGDAPGESVRAVAGIDLRVEPGELVAVMGPTGSGKSSLAMALAGLVEPAAGRIDGHAVGATRLVLQRPEASFLAEHVIDEVCLALRYRGEPEAAAARHGAALLDALGLPRDALERDPLALSGGEQRRVAIAATLASDARVLVLDEPSAGLDHAARGHLHDVLRGLHVAGRTIVLVTHDPDEAAAVATRLVVLREGGIAWDGPVAPVLGDPNAARERGLAVAPEVALLHAAAAARGVTLDEQPATSAGATEALARLLEGATGPRSATRESSSQPSVPRRDPVRAALRPLVDARVRVLATGIVMVAALMAASLAAAAIMAAACAAVVVAARIDRARVRLAVRPLVALTVMLVLLQLLVGGAPDTQLWHGRDAGFAAAPALLRSLQAAAIVLATLALGAATTALDLASALRRLLAPLAIVRVPVASLAFVVATALGLVPAMADELERLRLARRARGIEPRGRHPLARLRADAALVAPLFVAAFRRAHLLADALAVRGVDPREPGRPWRPMHVPSSDVLLLVAGVALLAVSRFA